MIMNLPGIFLKQLVIAVVVPTCIATLFLAVDWRVFLAYIALMPAAPAIFFYQTYTEGMSAI